MSTQALIDNPQAALGFVVSQTAHIEQQVNETIYPDIQYPTLIPVDTTAHPFAQTVTYFSSDKFGQAGWVNGEANDIPLAGTERASHNISVHMAAIGYVLGYEEINQAQMLGIDLRADEAMAARRAYEEFVDRIALTGDADKGFSGLINHPSVTASAATSGNWTTASANDILGDINVAMSNFANNTGRTRIANSLLLPYSHYDLLATRRVSDNSDTTLLQQVKQANIYSQTTGEELLIRGVRDLDSAGAGNSARMIAYFRDPQVLKLHIPMPHRFLPAYQNGPLSFMVPGVFRLGGLDVRRPAEISYVDGI